MIVFTFLALTLSSIINQTKASAPAVSTAIDELARQRKAARKISLVDGNIFLRDKFDYRKTKYYIDGHKVNCNTFYFNLSTHKMPFALSAIGNDSQEEIDEHNQAFRIFKARKLMLEAIYKAQAGQSFTKEQEASRLLISLALFASEREMPEFMKLLVDRTMLDVVKLRDM